MIRFGLFNKLLCGATNQAPEERQFGKNHDSSLQSAALYFYTDSK
jgi:hypothetical protein